MRHVIVGNGVAGVTAAAELAERGAGEIEIYAAEPYPYYFRPQLPRFLAGEVPQEKLYARPQSWYEDRGIGVHLDTEVTHLAPRAKRVALADGTEVPYDRLLLSTGGYSFVPPVSGADKRGVFTLRTLDDALAIREHAARCEQAVVLGGGLLGLESARGLKALGLSVTVLEFFSHLLPRQLDEDGAAVFLTLVEGLGIDVAVNANCKAVEGDGEVTGVVLEDGREFPAQMVLVATGMRCNAGLASDAGLRVDRGVVVDERMAASAADVYAAGDATSFQGRSWGIIPQARAQAQVAAANMAGANEVYEEIIPSTTLKIVGINLTSCGVRGQEDDECFAIRRSDPDKGIYKKLVLKGDTAVQTIVIGDRALARKLEELVVRQASLSREEAAALL
jgi:nitrite reductase (NADH) large subunit